MIVSQRFYRSIALLCLFAGSPCTFAQRPQASYLAAATSRGYNMADDSSLQGTILSYTENSKMPPLGAHVLLETSSGNVDVHLGDARVLQRASVNLARGMSVRFVGQSQNVGQSTVFLARLVQVGSQVVAVRSTRGLPLSPGSARGKAAVKSLSTKQAGGAR